MPKKLPADCMPRCGSCAFRVYEKEVDGSFCHRHPPVPVTDDEGFGFTHIPVDIDGWCGEYVRFSS